MISPVHVKTQPADCSQSEKQDNGIGMIDFNFPLMSTKTVVYHLLTYRWRTLDVIRYHNYLARQCVRAVLTGRQYGPSRLARIINLRNAAKILGGRCGFFKLLDEAQVSIHRQLKYS